jgi:methionine-S-sulfoxide reductase
VWRTRAGYAGGTKSEPTYRSLGDHTECLQVDFDPEVLDYEDLLEMFWTSHDPVRPASKLQYASLVLAHDAEQLAMARDSADRLEALTGRKVTTRIELLDKFWIAEDYHQKYYLRNDWQLVSEFGQMYPEDADFVRSTAAARVNGYLYGAGSCLQLETEIDLLGLGDEGKQRVREHCRH